MSSELLFGYPTLEVVFLVALCLSFVLLLVYDVYLNESERERKVKDE